MTGSRVSTRLKSHLLDVLSRIPHGRVVGHTVLARELDVDVRHVMALLLQLEPAERETLPWHRVVADGGAVGRHPWREDQISRLQAEGIAVAPVGIVQDLVVRRIDGFVNVQAMPSSGQIGGQISAGSRSRGSKGTPKSSVP